jgi:hypothetical protein
MNFSRIFLKIRDIGDSGDKCDGCWASAVPGFAETGDIGDRISVTRCRPAAGLPSHFYHTHTLY